MTIRRLSSLATLVVLVASTAFAGPPKAEPLTLKMSANLTVPKTDVIVHMRIAPDPRSRQLTVEWLADDLSGGSSVITLEGERAATAHQYRLKQLPAGRYTVIATLTRDDGSAVTRKAELAVIGVGGPDLFSEMSGAARAGMR